MEEKSSFFSPGVKRHFRPKVRLAADTLRKMVTWQEVKREGEMRFFFVPARRGMEPSKFMHVLRQEFNRSD